MFRNTIWFRPNRRDRTIIIITEIILQTVLSNPSHSIFDKFTLFEFLYKWNDTGRSGNITATEYLTGMNFFLLHAFG